MCLAVGATACGSNTPASSRSTTTLGVAASTTTSAPAGTQTTGTRTVISPIGLNVRSAPSSTASVLGTAAQGVTLTVLGYTAQGGGWYQVKGSTVTGYISSDATLSAQGAFMGYSAPSGAFSALYPSGWTATAEPPSGVDFYPSGGSDSIVVTTATSTAALGQVQTGYSQVNSSSAVVCGVTGNLVTYMTTAATSTPSATAVGGTTLEAYQVQIALTLGTKQYLGVTANLASLNDLPTVQDLVYSLSFPIAQCVGAAAVPPSTTTPSTTHTGT